jgi:hypothetical protein
VAEVGLNTVNVLEGLVSASLTNRR